MTSLQGTNGPSPMCPLFGGFTVKLFLCFTSLVDCSGKVTVASSTQMPRSVLTCFTSFFTAPIEQIQWNVTVSKVLKLGLSLI